MPKKKTTHSTQNFFESITTKRHKKKAEKKAKKTDTEKIGWGRRIARFFLYLLIFGVFSGIVGAIVIVIYLAQLMSELPSPQELANFSLIESTRIYDKEGNLLYEVHGDERREQVSLEQIPSHCVNALLSAEDANFYEHGGFSWTGITRAVYKDIMHKITGSGSLQGGSTITQQFVKNAYLTRDKTVERKLKELILSMQIENAYSKDEILEMYLNTISYGSNAHGIQTASKTFFAKDVSELSLSQCAMLAALPQAPSYYSPYGSHTDILVQRKDWVLSRMLELGHVDSFEYETSQNEDVLATIEPFKQEISAPHFVFYVKEVLEERYGTEQVEKGGLQVYTTLDPHLQEVAEQAVKDGIEGPLLQYNATNSALVSIEPITGNIKAMVGSRDYFMDEVDGQVNIVTSLQQPGSSFKPFAYAGMFLNNTDVGPGTVLWDVETNFGNAYMPGNFDGQFWGPVSARRALAGSRNIPAIKAGYLGGIQETIALAYRMGLSTFEDSAALADHAGTSYALGTLEVTPLDLAVAYGTFANNGYYIPANAIMKVTDSSGNVIEEFQTPEGQHVIAPEDPQKGEQVAFLINDVLSDNSARPPGWGNLQINGHTVAAKTGTSNTKKNGVNYPQDLWTIGYTPSVVTVAWGGNTKNGALTKNASGLMGIAPTWNAYMTEALKDSPDEEFIRPDLIKNVAVTRSSGFLPSGEAPSGLLVSDMFADFGVPDIYDEGYRIAQVDKNTGLLINEFCPEPEPVTYVYQNAHSVLYYINKEDSQFSRWEPAVRNWFTRKVEEGETLLDIGNESESESDSENTGATNEIIYVDSPDQIPTESCTESMLENWDKRAQVTFLKPYQGGKIGAGNSTVELQIDAELGIEEVRYFLDNELFETRTNRPYNEATVFIPVDTEIGTKFTLKVIAIDGSDNRTVVENTVEVTADATPPEVEIVEPRNNQRFNPGEAVEIVVEAKDNESSIESIEILFNGSLIATLPKGGSYTFTIPSDTEKDDHTITVRAFDTEKNAELDSVEIRVSGRALEDDDTIENGDSDDSENQTEIESSISLQAMSDDEVTVNEAIPVSLTVAGSLDDVTKIKLYANSQRIDVLFDVTANTQASWTPRSEGEYALKAELIGYNDEILAESNVVTIKVKNNS